MIAALKHLQSLAPEGTSLGSAELRDQMAGVERKSIFSARTNLLAYVEQIKAAVADMLGGDDNLATARLKLKNALAEFGYDPQTGFADAPDASIPPAERGSLQDLGSDARLKLVLQTNFRQALNFRKKEAGNEPDALEQFPAWELLRIYAREIPRGEKRGPQGTVVEDPGNDWPSRFRQAAEATGDDDALRVLDDTDRMIARKDSPVWEYLGDPDNFDDAIGTDYPPLAFNSGYGWQAVSRAECVEIGLIEEDDTIAPAKPETFGEELLFDPTKATLANWRATRNELAAAVAAFQKGGAA